MNGGGSKIAARADFDADNIASINVNLRYGNQPHNVILNATNPTAELDRASIIQNNAMQRDITVDYTVNFKNSDGGERPARLQATPFHFDGDSLEIDRVAMACLP